jgi:hypothetical protein
MHLRIKLQVIVMLAMGSFDSEKVAERSDGVPDISANENPPRILEKKKRILAHLHQKIAGRTAISRLSQATLEP